MKIDVPATRQPSGNMPAKIRDLESRMPARHNFRSKNIVTWAHETTHGLNSRIRNSLRNSRVNAFYLYDGVAITANEPDFHISDFAHKVPVPLRGRIYRLYLVSQASSWNDRPLYLFDEWVAYQNGSIVARDENIGSRDDSLASCLEMATYCAYLLNGAVKGGDLIMPDQTVNDCFREMLTRMKVLFDRYQDNIGDTNKTIINNYLDTLRGTFAADTFVLFDVDPETLRLR